MTAVFSRIEGKSGPSGCLTKSARRRTASDVCFTVRVPTATAAIDALIRAEKDMFAAGRIRTAGVNTPGIKTRKTKTRRRPRVDVHYRGIITPGLARDRVVTAATSAAETSKTSTRRAVRNVELGRQPAHDASATCHYRVSKQLAQGVPQQRAPRAPFATR